MWVRIEAPISATLCLLSLDLSHSHLVGLLPLLTVIVAAAARPYNAPQWIHVLP